MQSDQLSKPLPQTRLRVAQWATGNIGMRSLHSLIQHPRMTLVGLYVYSEAKAGRDAGELCGLGPMGVKAVQDLETIVAARPDCVLYMPQATQVEELCRLLAAGINVVTTRGDFHNPGRMDPEHRQRIEQACREGNASIHSTGSSPGFITEALPLVLTSLQRRVDGIHIQEYADVSSRDSPQLLFDMMGFNKAPEEVSSEVRSAYLCQSFGPSLEVLANALGLAFDELDAFGEVACARHAVHMAAGVIEPGKVAAQRTTVRGLRDGRPLVTFAANWFCSDDIEPHWDLAPTGWNVSVEGDVPLEVTLRFPVPLEQWAAVSPGITAHRAVNAVPYVCEAAPGIRTSVELPQIVSDLRPIG